MDLLEEIVVSTVIAGDPVPKARPRVTRNGGSYTPKRTRDAEEQLGWQLRAAGVHGSPDRDALFGVSAWFFTRTRRRTDVDNLLKLVLDACNGLVWADDVQVEEVFARVRRGQPEPRTELLIYRLEE